LLPVGQTRQTILNFSCYVAKADPSTLLIVHFVHTNSWEEFRVKVLGATDPKTAAEGSARREIYEKWKELKLKAVPNVGDNGVHASASPFEAFTERCHWLKASPEADAFGAACLAAGVSKETLLEYANDPTVNFEGKPAVSRRRRRRRRRRRPCSFFLCSFFLVLFVVSQRKKLT